MPDGRSVDAHLLAACRRGDREAFRALFERFGPRVHAVALGFTADRALAADVTQQVFLKLFTRLDQFQDHARFTTWLYRIVVNACLDDRRARRRTVPLDDTVPAAALRAPSFQESMERREAAAAVRRAVAALSPRLRIAVVLKYYEGLSYEEMAAALDCSPGTVASRLNRGHAALARELAPRPSTPGGTGP